MWFRIETRDNFKVLHLKAQSQGKNEMLLKWLRVFIFFIFFLDLVVIKQDWDTSIKKIRLSEAEEKNIKDFD